MRQIIHTLFVYINDNLQDTCPCNVACKMSDQCLNKGGLRYMSRFVVLELSHPNYSIMSSPLPITSFSIILTVTEGMNAAISNDTRTFDIRLPFPPLHLIESLGTRLVT